MIFMLRLKSPWSAAIVFALLIGAAAVVVLGWRGGGGEGGAETAPTARERGRSIASRPAARGRERTKSVREAGTLTAQEIRDRMPPRAGQGVRLTLSRGKLPEESALLFRSLGRLEGEAALDEIVGRYGDVGSYAAAAAAQVILGWMEVDREAAVAAFRELAGPTAAGSTELMFCWKGKSFLSGYGGSGATVLQFAMRDVLAGVARMNELEGQALLREEPWCGAVCFVFGLQGLADGMAAGSDWRQLRAQLGALIVERDQDRAGKPAIIDKQAAHEQHHLNQILALRWARDDMTAAVEWYVNEVAPPGPGTSRPQRIVELLRQMPVEDRTRVVDWFEQQRSEARWDDAVAVEYAKQLVFFSLDANTERLAAMPDEESNRVAIVSLFVTPQKRNGKLSLRFKRESLTRLIKAANLSLATEARMLEMMTTGGGDLGRGS